MSDGVRWASRSSTGTVRIRKNEERRFPPLFPLVGAHANNNCHEGTLGDDRKMNNEPLECEPMNNEPLEREPNAAPRCGARSKRTAKPCQGAAMPNGRCKLHGGKSTGPRTPEGLERSRRANWKHGHFSREAKAERSRLRAAILVLRDLRDSI